MPGSPPSRPETPTPSGWRRSGCVPAIARHSTPGWRRIRHTIQTLLPGRRTCRNTSIPQDAAAKAHDARADAAFAKGSEAGQTADKYIRATVFLATVLFLVGISGHFRIRQARMGLIGAGGLLLAFAVIQLLGLPGPPA